MNKIIILVMSMMLLGAGGAIGATVASEGLHQGEATGKSQQRGEKKDLKKNTPGGKNKLPGPAYKIIKNTYVLSPGRQVESCVIESQSDEPITLQVRAKAQSRPGHYLDKLTPTTDVSVYPPIIRLEGRQAQTVRIAAQAAFGDDEREYLIEVMDITPKPKYRRLEDGATSPKVSVAVKIRYLLKVLMEPLVAHPKGVLTVHQTGQVLEATVKNTGNFTAIISRIVFADPKTDKVIGAVSDRIHIRKGECHTWRIKPHSRSSELVQATVYMLHGPIVLTAKA